MDPDILIITTTPETLVFNTSPPDVVTMEAPGPQGPGYDYSVHVPANGAAITLDASLGNQFRFTLTADAILAAPTGPRDGQKITVEVIQDSVGGHSLTFGTGFGFSLQLPAPTITQTPGKRDFLGFTYSADSGLWYFLSLLQNF